MYELTSILILLGVALGSFLNVCIYRIPRGLSLVTISSFCPSCLRPLRWHENIPIVSFVISKGKCRGCFAKIPVSYPIIEMLTAAAALVLFLSYGPSGEYVYVTLFWLLMLPIAIIDWKHFVIPNGIILVGLLIGLIVNVVVYPQDMIERMFASLLASTTLVIVMYLGNLVFGRQTMGMGDVKLAGLIGLFLGFQNFFIALWLAAIVGSIYGGWLKTRSRSRAKANCGYGTFYSSDLKLPFGSFVAVSSSIVLLIQKQISVMIESWLIWLQ